jgi:SnoaL-like domain
VLVDDSELRIRVGVADLMSTYQFLADHGKLTDLSQLFLPDATYTTNTEQFNGPAAVLEFFKRTGDAFSSTGLLPARHHLSSIYIEPRQDGSARTYACFGLVGSRGLDHWGTYRDEVVATSDGWRLARRKVKIEGHVPDSPVVALLGLTTTA